jgi:hypothetical protein
MIMKKIYQMPEMMAAEMMSLSMIAATTGPQISINKNASPKDVSELDVKGSAWDDFDE